MKKILQQKATQYLLVISGFLSVFVLLVFLLDSLILPLVVSKNDIIVVPNVENLNSEEAKEAIVKSGLIVQGISEQFNDKIPAGVVIAQLPFGGTKVKEGRRVYLTVSKGKETLRMPFLVGKPIRDARVELIRLGLSNATERYEFSESVTENYVIAQNFPSGQIINPLDPIALIISKGSSTALVVPSIIDLSREDAENLLKQFDLIIGDISFQKNETYDPGYIIQQQPTAGTKVAPNTKINVIISE